MKTLRVTENETGVQAGTTEDGVTRPRKGLWHSLRYFMKSRPFWGCLILAAGGWFVMRPIVGSSFEMLMHMGTRGAAVYVLGGGMMLAAAIAFVAPSQRYFPAVMAAVFSVASLPLANLGGWLIGMVLGIIGSGLVFAWTPYTAKQIADSEERARRKAERKAAKRALQAA